MRNWFVIVMALSGAGSWNGNVMSAFSRNRRRILSLWLPRLPTDRIKRQLARDNAAPANSSPCIVVAKQNNALQISALDDAAAHLGLEIGLPLANARAICPQLQVFDADEVADARALNVIADWCDRFTPLVALDSPHGLFLDITGCAHLFGGEAALMQIICEALTRQGFAVSAGTASTSICARTMPSSRNVATCSPALPGGTSPVSSSATSSKLVNASCNSATSTRSGPNPAMR